MEHGSTTRVRSGILCLGKNQHTAIDSLKEQLLLIPAARVLAGVEELRRDMAVLFRTTHDAQKDKAGELQARNVVYCAAKEVLDGLELGNPNHYTFGTALALAASDVVSSVADGKGGSVIRNWLHENRFDEEQHRDLT